MTEPRPGRDGRPDGPWDPGLQPERSSAAWSRTALAASIVAVLVARTAPGTVSMVVGLVGLAVASGLSLLASRRIRRVLARLHDDAPIRPAFTEVAAMAGLAMAMPAITVTLLLLG